MTGAPGAPGAARLTLLTRADCHLCDEMLAALSRLSLELPLPALAIQDVDDDALLASRHRLDIPVLLLDGVIVCKHHLDDAELRRLLRPR